MAKNSDKPKSILISPVSDLLWESICKWKREFLADNPHRVNVSIKEIICHMAQCSTKEL